MSIVKKTLFGDYNYSHSACPNLSGKVALVTGGTNGLGLSLARTLYAHQARVLVFGHRDDVAEKAVAYIKSGKLTDAPEEYAKGFGSGEDSSGGAEGQGEVELIKVDMEDLAKVNEVAKDLAGKLDRLDLFAGLAGKGLNAFSLAPTSPPIDSHLALNNLSHHVLLSHLLPVLRKTSQMPGADVRIVNMSSELHRATFGGPQWGGRFKDEKEWSEDVGPNNLYARTKLCVILFSKALVQRYLPGKDPIFVASTHPGAVATGQQAQFKDAYGDLVGGAISAAVRPFMRKPDEGSLSILWALVAPDARAGRDEGKWEQGAYFSDPAVPGGESSEASDQELIDNFFDGSESIIKKIVGSAEVGKWKKA